MAGIPRAAEQAVCPNPAGSTPKLYLVAGAWALEPLRTSYGNAVPPNRDVTVIATAGGRWYGDCTAFGSVTTGPAPATAGRAIGDGANRWGELIPVIGTSVRQVSRAGFLVQIRPGP